MTKYEKGTIGYYIELAKEVGYPYDIKNNSIGPFLKWAQENRMLLSNAEISRRTYKRRLKERGFNTDVQYRDYTAKINGYENHAERLREWVHNKGIHSPMSENDDCSDHLGIYIGEIRVASNVLPLIFKYVEKMPPKNPRFDFICKDPRQEFIDKYPQFKLEEGKEYKIDSKARSLIGGWKYHIDNNDITDYFFLQAFIGEDELPAHIWFIHKNEMIIKHIGGGYRLVKFHDRTTFDVYNNPENILLYQKYDLKHELSILKEILQEKTDDTIE